MNLDGFSRMFNVKIPPGQRKQMEEKLEKKLEKINAHNEKFGKGEASFTMRVYPWSLLTEEEFRRKMTGLFPAEGNSIFLPTYVPTICYSFV